MTKDIVRDLLYDYYAERHLPPGVTVHVMPSYPLPRRFSLLHAVAKAQAYRIAGDFVYLALIFQYRTPKRAIRTL